MIIDIIATILVIIAVAAGMYLLVVTYKLAISISDGMEELHDEIDKNKHYK
jgi:hypothetical protein